MEGTNIISDQAYTDSILLYQYKFVLIDGYNLLFRTRKQEEQYQEICCRIMNAKTHFVNAKTTMSSLKAEKPKIVRNVKTCKECLY